MHIFNHNKTKIKNIHSTSKNFHQQTIKILQLTFLSSNILKFFTSLSITLITIYFNFSYLNKLNFNHYNTNITLTTNFLTLILTPKFFQPLHNLNTFYHTKTQTINTTNNLKTFIKTPLTHPQHNKTKLTLTNPLTIKTKNLFITSPKNKTLTKPLNFTLPTNQHTILINHNNSNKNSLLNTLSNFLSYQKSLQINKIKLHNLSPKS